jgi:ADP-ribosylglycohydrolase
MNSIELLARLFAEGRIAAARGPIFETQPLHLPAGFDFGRVEGMLLGLAVGDSLGRTSESRSPADRHAAFGEIRDFVGPVLPTDDTQLAAWTLEHLIERRGQLDPEALGALFASRRIRGLGSSVREFLRARKAGERWERCAPRSAGNGALMRIAPVLIPHLRHPSPTLWADAALAGMVTHNDPASIAACVGFVAVLWGLLRMDAPPPAGWVARTWLEAARGLDDGSPYEPRRGALMISG